MSVTVADELKARTFLVEYAIDRAPFSRRLPDEILAMGGFGCRQVLELLNRLCDGITLDPPASYLEFGAYLGRSLLAAAWHNRGAFIGLEDFRQRHQLGGDPVALADNLRRGRELGADAAVLEHDWRRYRPATDVSVFFYDAEHSADATAAAVVHIAPFLAHPSVLVVDDLEVMGVYPGLVRGLDEARLAPRAQWELRKADGWHEGLYVGVLP